MDWITDRDKMPYGDMGRYLITEAQDRFVVTAWSPDEAGGLWQVCTYENCPVEIFIKSEDILGWMDCPEPCERPKVVKVEVQQIIYQSRKDSN